MTTLSPLTPRHHVLKGIMQSRVVMATTTHTHTLLPFVGFLLFCRCMLTNTSMLATEANKKHVWLLLWPCGHDDELLTSQGQSTSRKTIDWSPSNHRGQSQMTDRLPVSVRAYPIKTNNWLVANLYQCMYKQWTGHQPITGHKTQMTN